MSANLRLRLLGRRASSRRRADAGAMGQGMEWAVILIARRGVAAVVLAGYCLSATGCTDWFRVPGGPVPANLPKHAQVWVADSAFLVRNPVLRNDSLLGTVRLLKSDTVGVPVGWRVEDVDSVQVRHTSGTRTFLVAVGIAAGMLLLVGLALQGSETEL